MSPAATAGVVLAIVVYRRRDLHLVAYVVGALLIGGSFRSPINRYVASIAPILLLLGAGAVFTAARLIPWRPTPTIVVALLLGALTVGNIVQARTRIESAQAVAERGAVEWGPTHPDAVEMFARRASRSATPATVDRGAEGTGHDPRDRAMLAVQVDDYRPTPRTTLPIAPSSIVERGSDLAADTRGLAGGPFTRRLGQQPLRDLRTGRQLAMRSSDMHVLYGFAV